jgi:cytidylate kinase
MENIILTIGREYGSGGRYIGEQVAKKLNIPFYDKELINKVYQKSGYDYNKVAEYDEVKKNCLDRALDILSISNQEEIYDSDMYQIFMEDAIKELADNGSCIILGRNSNNILKDRNNVINLFIYSNDFDFKIKRKMEIENISYEEANKRLKDIDKKRKKYYEYFNKNRTWGSYKEYDFCIDSSILGIEKTIDLIVEIYNLYKKN